MLISADDKRICFSPSDAAKALRIGKSTLFAILAAGKIKARKLGTRTLITASELSRYVESLPEARFHADIDERGARHG